MGSSNFKKIKTVIKKFKLDMQLVDLFDSVKPIKPSAWLIETLEMAEIAPLTNAKSKSERIVSPILLEIAKSYRNKISLFSGEDINVKSEDDLSGPCDFFFSLQLPKLYVEAPIISIAESKDEDMECGALLNVQHRCTAQNCIMIWKEKTFL
jgi:hypothetical protein